MTQLTKLGGDASQARGGRYQPVRLAYSVADAIAATGLGKTTIYALLADGRLPSVKIGNRRLIRSADLEALLREGHQRAA